MNILNWNLVFFLIFFSCQTTQIPFQSKILYTSHKKEKELWIEFRIALEKKDFTKVENLLKKFNSTEDPEKLFLIGKYYFDVLEFEKAKTFLEKSFFHEPKLESGILLSQTYSLLGQPKESIKILNVLNSSYPNSREIQFHLALHYKSQKKYFKAEKILQELINQDFNSFDYKFHYLDVLLLQNKYEKANLWLEIISNSLSSNQKNKLKTYWYVNSLTEKAKKNFESKNFKSSIEDLEKAYELDPYNGELAYTLVKLLCKQNQLSRAEEIISDMEISSWKYLSLGEYFFTKSNWIQAEEFWKEGITLYPNYKDFYINLSWMYWNLNDKNSAKFYAILGEKQNKTEPVFHFLLGLFYIDELQFELALEEFEEAKNLGYGNEVTDAIQIVKLFIIIKNKNNTEDIEALERVLNETENKKLKTIAFSTLGYYYMEKKDYEKAKNFYQKVLDIDSKSFSAYFGLLKIYRQEENLEYINQTYYKIQEIIKGNKILKEKYTQFLNSLDLQEKKYIDYNLSKIINSSVNEILELYLQNPNLNLLYQILQELEKLQKKEKIFLLLSNLSELDSSYREIQATYHFKYGDYQKAEELFTYLRETKNNYYVEYHLGLIFQRTDVLKSLENFTVSMKLNPEFAPSCLALANSYVKINNYSKAIEQFNNCKKKFPNFDLIYYNLGIALLEVGDISEAEKNFLEMKEKFPKSPEAYYGLYLTAKKLNDKNKLFYYYKLHQRFIKNSKNHYELETKQAYKIIHLLDKPKFTPIVIDNYIYIPYENSLQKFHISSQKLIWRISIPEGYKEIFPSMFGILLYYPNNTFLFLDKENGIILFNKKIISKNIEKIVSCEKIIFSVVLPSNIRKLYELNLNGNLTFDLLLEQNENWDIDQNSRVYLWKKDDKSYIVNYLDFKWEKKFLNRIYETNLEFLGRFSKGIFLGNSHKAYQVSTENEFLEFWLPLKKELPMLYEWDNILYAVYNKNTYYFSKKKWFVFSQDKNTLCSKLKCENFNFLWDEFLVLDPSAKILIRE